MTRITNSEWRPRLLYVCHRVPYPPDKGDRIRNYHPLRQFATFADVSLACLADEPVSQEKRTELNRLSEHVAIEPVTKIGRAFHMGLNALCGRSLSEGAFWNPSMANRINDWHRAKPFDVAVCSASSVAAYLRQGTLINVPAFVDIVDCDSRKWSDFAKAVSGPKRWLYRFEAKRVLRLERKIASWAAACTVVSDAEAAIFDEGCGPGSATTATNGVDLDSFQPRSTHEELACTFVGAMDYLPNVDAVRWFADEIWPAVRVKHPAAEFRIVGRKPTDAVQKLSSRPGIVVSGTVPDVRDYVARSAVVVVPMRLSRGLQNKVLESLAMAKATVVAPPALTALRAVPGRDLLRAESAEDWVTTVCQLFSDPDRRRTLGQNGRAFVEANHDWATCLRPMTDLIRAAAESRQPSGVPA